MALVRRQRRIGGAKQNYWLCTETGAEYLSKPRRADTVTSNSMQGVIGWAWLADADSVRGCVQDAFGRFCSADGSDRPGISIQRLVQLADTQPVLYSVRHQDSPNSAEYDAALTLLLRLVQHRLPEWREEFCLDATAATGGGIHQFMQELGYNTEYSYRGDEQFSGAVLDVDAVLAKAGGTE